MADNELLQSTAVDANNDYNASEIQVLEGLEAVRKPPGYVHRLDLDERGLHHLVYEIVDNAIDEALAGVLRWTITVTDRSRTTPSPSPITAAASPWTSSRRPDRPALEVVFTVLHAGGKFGGGGYKVSGGLHGVGASGRQRAVRMADRAGA